MLAEFALQISSGLADLDVAEGIYGDVPRWCKSVVPARVSGGSLCRHELGGRRLLGLGRERAMEPSDRSSMSPTPKPSTSRRPPPGQPLATTTAWKTTRRLTQALQVGLTTITFDIAGNDRSVAARPALRWSSIR
jgi:hypothetical protein